MRSRGPLFVLLVLLSGCGAPSRVQTTRDDLGRDVAIPPRIERIVTLAPNITEMLFALGAGSKLVGVDDFSNFPEAARRLPRVGGMQPNVERIAALRPDLVFATTEGNHPNLAPALAAAGIPLYVVRTDRLSEISQAMDRVGAIVDAPERMNAVTALNDAVAAERRTRAKRPRLLFAIWTDPLYVAGRETFTDDLFALTGASNAVDVRGWPQYSLESLVANPPDIILYPRGAVTPQQIDAFLRRVPSVHVPVIAVDEDIYQRPGPRVAEAAHSLNAILDGWSAPE